MDDHSTILTCHPTIANFSRCCVRRVIDGDTVEADIDIGFNMIMQDQRIRLYGVNCPESRTTDLEEKQRGIAATQFVMERLTLDIIVLVQMMGKDPFGRWLGKLFYYNDATESYVFLNQELLDNNHAVPTKLNLGT